MNNQNTPENTGVAGETLLKIDQVARYMQVSERHVRNLMRQKLIPVVRVGGAVRFDLAEVKDAIRQLTVSARR